MSQITFTEFLSSFCIILSQINLNQNLNRASTSGWDLCLKSQPLVELNRQLRSSKISPSGWDFQPAGEILTQRLRSRPVVEISRKKKTKIYYTKRNGQKLYKKIFKRSIILGGIT